MIVFSESDLKHFQYESDIGFHFNYEYTVEHTQEFWEFAYVVSNIYNETPNERVLVPANSFLIVRPNEIHKVTAQKHIDADNFYTHLNIPITKKALENLISLLWGSDLYKELERESGIVFFRSRHDERKYQEMLKRLLSASNADSQEARFILKTMITDMLYSYYEHKTSLKELSAHGNIVNVLANRMTSAENFSRSLAELIRDTHYSYMQINRLFVRETGKTPGVYFTNAKLEHAAKLLRITDMPVSDIASKVGYVSLSHFDRVFKKMFGISPSEYRASVSVAE